MKQRNSIKTTTNSTQSTTSQHVHRLRRLQVTGTAGRSVDVASGAVAAVLVVQTSQPARWLSLSLAVVSNTLSATFQRRRPCLRSHRGGLNKLVSQVIGGALTADACKQFTQCKKHSLTQTNRVIYETYPRSAFLSPMFKPCVTSLGQIEARVYLHCWSAVANLHENANSINIEISLSGKLPLIW